MLQERGAFVFRLENNYKNFLHKFSPKCKVKFEKSLTKFRCWVGFFSTKISIFSFDPNFEVGLDFFPPKYLFLVSTQISIKILLSTNKFTTKFSIVSILWEFPIFEQFQYFLKISIFKEKNNLSNSISPNFGNFFPKYEFAYLIFICFFKFCKYVPKKFLTLLSKILFYIFSVKSIFSEIFSLQWHKTAKMNKKFKIMNFSDVNRIWLCSLCGI